MSWINIVKESSNKNNIKLIKVRYNIHCQSPSIETYKKMDNIPRHKEIIAHPADDFVMRNYEKVIMTICDFIILYPLYDIEPIAVKHDNKFREYMSSFINYPFRNDKTYCTIIDEIRNGQYGAILADKINGKIPRIIKQIVKKICDFIILHRFNGFESILKWVKHHKLREHMISLGFSAQCDKTYCIIINKIIEGQYGQIAADKVKQMMEEEYIKGLSVYLDKLNNTFNENEKNKDGDCKELTYHYRYSWDLLQIQELTYHWNEKGFTADSIISDYVNNKIRKSDIGSSSICVKYEDEYWFKEEYFITFPPIKNVYDDKECIDEYFDEYDGIIIDLNEALQVLCYEFISNEYRNNSISSFIMSHDICNLICKYYPKCSALHHEDIAKRIKQSVNKLPFLMKNGLIWEPRTIYPKHLKCKTLDILKNCWIWKMYHVIDCFIVKCTHCIGNELNSVYLYQWVDYIYDHYNHICMTGTEWFEAQVIEIDEVCNKIKIEYGYSVREVIIDLNNKKKGNRVYPLHTFTKRGKSIGSVQCEIGTKCFYKCPYNTLDRWFMAEILDMNKYMVRMYGYDGNVRTKWYNKDSYHIAPIFELKCMDLNQWIDSYDRKCYKWYKAQIIEINNCDKNHIKVRYKGRGMEYDEVIDLNKESHIIAPYHTFT